MANGLGIKLLNTTECEHTLYKIRITYLNHQHVENILAINIKYRHHVTLGVIIKNHTTSFS